MDDHVVGKASVGLVVGWGDPAVTGTASAGGFVLPTGTVAFLLTDVEASTRAWEAEPDAMAVAMGRHNAIVDVAVSAHGGVRPLAQGEGDSIVAAFSRASDAVLAAVDAQRALTTECWPTSTPLRVRMAVHAGEARTAADGNYAGQAIIRTARLRAITNGGQILVSEPARDLLVDHLGDKVTLVDLGEHRLRDLARPERVFQVIGSGLPSDFPPLDSLDAHRHNLPVQLSSFVGRIDDIATVAGLVRGNRLVTIVGAGGSGKTRLALQAAAELVDQSTDGTWWVELAAVRDPDLAVGAIAGAIGVRGEVGAGAADALAHVLVEQEMLLVLDNCEHLVEVVALAVDKLLRGCPSIRVLATSRVPLEVSGEIAWRVPPMTCPAADGAALAVAALSQFDSVRLFLDRAQHVRPSFTVDDGNAPAIAAISSRLDGVPLAIELAAARCRSMTPAQILVGLTDAFRLLTGSSRGVLPRQATLEASITWSHDLLSEPEKVLFRRLSVFAGGCTLDAAEAVCSDDDVVPALAVLDLLDRLVAQSLVTLDDQPDAPRYRMLETVRQYGAGRLNAAGEADTLRNRHFGHHLDTITAIRPTFQAADRGLEPAVVRLLWWERDNYLVALDHAASEGRWTDYATLATRAGDILGEGHPDEGVVILDRIPRDALGRALKTEVAWNLCNHLLFRGDPRFLVELDQVLALGADGVHPYLVALAIQFRVLLVAILDPVRAGPMLDEAAVARDASGDPMIEMAHAFAGLFLRGATQGDITLANPYIEELDRLRSVLPNVSFTLQTDIWTAVVADRVGDLARASECLDRAEQWLAERRNPGAPALTWGRERNRINRGAPSPYAMLSAYKLARRQALHLSAYLLGLTAGQGLLVSGDAASAFATFDEVQDSAAASGIVGTVAVLAPWAGRAALALGDVDEARARLALADEVATTNELTWNVGLAKAVRAEVALVDGDPDAPAVALVALEFTAAHTFRLEQVDVLEVLTVLASESHDHREVVRLQGAVTRARDDLDYSMRIPRITERVDAAIDAALEALGEEAFNAAFDDGKRLDLEEVTAYVLRSHGERKRPSSGWASLTPTEHAVVEQVRLGLTNPQIAERLLMSRDTVKTHLSHIYTKLGVGNRTELAMVSPSGDRDNG